MDQESRKTKPSIPEVVPLVLEYYSRKGNGVGGIFHVILDDKNYEKCFADSALEMARETKDPLTIQIAEMLVEMSSTQRRKLSASLWWHALTDEQKAARRRRDEEVAPGA